MNNLGIFDPQGREHIADWVMHGNGRFLQRYEIQARIVKLLARIAKEIEELLHEQERSNVTADHTEPAQATRHLLRSGNDSARVESHSH